MTESALAADCRDWTVDQITAAVGVASFGKLSQMLSAIDRNGYRTFLKLKDGRKSRVISAPADWLKDLQRRMYDRVLLRLPVSTASYSRRGAGVVENARRHLGNPHLGIIDVKDCFPSTTLARVRRSLRDIGLIPKVADVIARLTTHRGYLPQGPPTSPAILDCVFLRIDTELSADARAVAAVYTRYMDDLAFSGPSPMHGFAQIVTRTLGARGYRVNNGKLKMWGPDEPHTITKIVLGTGLNPTDDFLRILTRELLEFPLGKSSLSVAQLRGKIAWVAKLNPPLGAKLRSKLAQYVR